MNRVMLTQTIRQCGVVGVLNSLVQFIDLCVQFGVVSIPITTITAEDVGQLLTEVVDVLLNEIVAGRAG